MSFPTKLLSTSPSLQRDYGIVRSQIAASSQKHALGGQLTAQSEVEEGQDDGLESQTEMGSSMTADQDNLSNLSLPGEQAPQAPLHQRRTSTGRSSRTSASSNVHTNLADHNRGGRSASLHGSISFTSPERQRRPSLAHGDAFGGYSQVAGIPSSYILGGQHMMPPADADMRSQDVIGDEEGVLEEDQESLTDEDPTPRPGRHRTGWLSPADQTPRPQANRSSYVHGSASESSPLLGTSGERVADFDGQHGVHPRSGWSRAGGTSGWDFLQPGPPGQGELDEIAEEPMTDNIRAREVRILFKYLVPTWGTHILELSLNIVSVFSLGHLGVESLAAASLSSMTANVTGYSILAGFISALDSLLPGAYTSQPKTVGLYTQRMAVIVLYLLPPIMLVWFFAEHILLLLGQDPVVASLAGQYLRILSLSLPGYAGFEVFRRYLQAQGLMHAPTVVLIVVSPINAFLNWLLVWGPEPVRLGFIGAPIASVVSTWLMCALCFAQCYVAPRVAWDGFTRRAFVGLKPVAMLGFYGTLAMVSEWWSWEIIGLTTSRLGTSTLASQSVLLVTSSIGYQLPFALSVAAAVRVGNLLGALQAKQAKVSSDMALLLSLVAGLFNSAIFLTFRKQWGGWFTADEEVIQMIYEVMPLLAAFQLADSVCGVAGGILRGTGRQAAGALINVTGYYAIGIPIGLILTFSRLQWGLAGLWTGLTIALIYAAVFSYLIIKRTDWEEEVQKTMERMGIHSQKPHEAEDAGAASASHLHT